MTEPLPTDLTLRPGMLDDLPGVTELLRTCDIADSGQRFSL